MRKNIFFYFACPVLLIILAMTAGCKGSGEVKKQKQVIVGKGTSKMVIESGGKWEKSGKALVGSGPNNFLIAKNAIKDDDFLIRLRMSLDSLNGSSAAISLFGSYINLDARPKEANGKPQLTVSGPLFSRNSDISNAENYIRAGSPFELEIKRKAQNLSFRIDDKEVFSDVIAPGWSGIIALQPSKNTMKVYDFSIQGDLSAVGPMDYLFESGKEGYQTFRIPAIVTTTKGTILAFAEGRKNSSSDTGDIDMVLKRSEDNGKTWSDLKVIWNDAENVCGNPSPVVDKTTGTIFLLMTWNLGTDRESEIISQKSKDTRRIFVTQSADDGVTWSVPVEITTSVKQNNWTWYATGPCHGIQLEKGKNNGRLIIPCDHIESGTNKYFSHIIYSDDHGKTWKTGGRTPQDQVNECTIAELPDGKLMLNMRNYDRTQKARKVSLSEDGGLTWSNIYSDPTLVEPICQGSLLMHSLIENGKSRLLFLNPANENIRKNMTLRLSTNEGAEWQKSMVLYPGPSAYSDLTRLSNGNIGCLYEAGYVHPYQGIIYGEIPLSELEK